MKNSKISEAYSSAILNIALKKDDLMATIPTIQLFHEVLSKEYIHSVQNNGTIEDKKMWVDEVFSNWLPSYWISLLHMLIDNHQFQIIQDVSVDFLEKGYEKLNVSYGKIFSAVSLSKEEMDKIKEQMQKILGRKVSLSNHVDKSLISGIRLEIEDQVYDNSMLDKTKKLRDEALKSMMGVV